MTKNQAITYFGDATKLATIIEVSPQAVYQWEGIPASQQWVISALTNFELVPDPDVLPETLSKNFFKQGSYTHNDKVQKLLGVANALAMQNRNDAIDALITLAAGVK